MRTAIKLAILLFAALSVPAQISSQSPTDSSGGAVTVIKAGTLIDGTGNAPRSNQVIVIRGNKIDSVGDAGSASIPQGARVIDLSRATVLPGLIESHTHIFLQGEEPADGRL